MPLARKHVTEDQARLKMADLCARSEQCEFDIMQKLQKMQLPYAQRENIIKFLKEERFIDDKRYAKSFANDKCKFSGWGPFKIRQALSLKRIDGLAVNEAIDEIEEKDWAIAIDRVANAKIRLTKDFDKKKYECKAKLYKFLMNRGFTSKQISGSFQRLEVFKEK